MLSSRLAGSIMRNEGTATVRVRLPESGVYHLRLLARSARSSRASASSAAPAAASPDAAGAAVTGPVGVGVAMAPELRYEAVCRLQLVARSFAPDASLPAFPPAAAPVFGPLGGQRDLLLPFHRDPVIYCRNGTLDYMYMYMYRHSVRTHTHTQSMYCKVQYNAVQCSNSTRTVYSEYSTVRVQYNAVQYSTQIYKVLKFGN